MKWLKRLLLILFALLVIGGLATPFVIQQALAPMAPGETTPISVEVVAGASGAEIAELLYEKGLIRHPLVLQLYVRYEGVAAELRPGKYAFNRGQSVAELVADLREGREDVVQVTIPEGLRISQMAELFAAEGFVADPEAFLAAARDPALFTERLPGAGNDELEPLEGYLFPDTYQFYRDVTPEEVVRTMLTHFHAVWQPEWNEAAERLGLTPHQVLTLASIVEDEAQVEAERPTIASVYLNRLAIDMKLDADPTVLYGLGKSKGEPLLLVDLEIDTPYNTYLHKGLPPGPISSPGRASIEAVLSPAETPYFFFVAKDDGSGEHYFSETYDEHRAYIDEIEARRNQ